VQSTTGISKVMPKTTTTSARKPMYAFEIGKIDGVAP